MNFNGQNISFGAANIRADAAEVRLTRVPVL
jgi:hypothetical protein